LSPEEIKKKIKNIRDEKFLFSAFSASLNHSFFNLYVKLTLPIFILTFPFITPVLINHPALITMSKDRCEYFHKGTVGLVKETYDQVAYTGASPPGG